MTNIRWIAQLVLSIAALSGGAQNPATGSQSTVPAQQPSFDDAKSLAAKGRLDQALDELNVLATASPEQAGVERLRGVILYQKDQLPAAEAAFRRAMAQDAGDLESTQMWGFTLYRLGRPAEAIPLLEGALKQAGAATPTSANADPRYVLGLCYTDTKRFDDARHAFSAQFAFAPDSAEAYLVTARLFLRHEFTDQADMFAGRAVELNPTLPLAHQLLGEIALAKADLPRAVKEFEAEKKINPLDGAMYDRLGDAYLRNGQFDEARAVLNKAVLLEPNATGPYILLGEALVKLGEPIQAIHYLNRAATMDPGNYVTHNALGEAYRALGQKADSNREYKLALEIQHRSDPKPENQLSGAH